VKYNATLSFNTILVIFLLLFNILFLGV